ncbi:MAG TPA: NUDIX hydrolase [bacterium]|nr:NUDIX hydrolase [bacterium]
MNASSPRPGHRAPAGSDPAKYERPSVACDVVMLSFPDSRLSALLIERRHDPYQGFWALPGGFVEMSESLEAAALREVREETGVTGMGLLPLRTYSDPDRDPRGRVISAAFLALLRALARPVAGDDARDARWFPLESLPELAFDHARIIADARERLREIAVMTPRVLDLLPEKFSAGQFLDLSGQVMGRDYDEAGFIEAMSRAPGFSAPDAAPGRGRTYQYDERQFHVGDFMFLLLGDVKR